MKNEEWSNREKLEIAERGEQLTAKYIHSFGNNQVMRPFENDEPHEFDGMVINKTTHQIKFIYDCKVKPEQVSSTYTGVDKHHYDKYKAYSEAMGVPLILFFIDYEKGYCYGGDINKLDKEAEPRILKDKYDKLCIYWNTDVMKKFYDLSDEDIRYIGERDSRHYSYIRNPEIRKLKEQEYKEKLKISYDKLER